MRAVPVPDWALCRKRRCPHPGREEQTGTLHSWAQTNMMRNTRQPSHFIAPLKVFHTQVVYKRHWQSQMSPPITFCGFIMLLVTIRGRWISSKTELPAWWMRINYIWTTGCGFPAYRLCPALPVSSLKVKTFMLSGGKVSERWYL